MSIFFLVFPKYFFEQLRPGQKSSHKNAVIIVDPAAAAQKIILEQLKKISTFLKKHIVLHILSEKCMGDSEWIGKRLNTHI